MLKLYDVIFMIRSVTTF